MAERQSTIHFDIAAISAIHEHLRNHPSVVADSVHPDLRYSINARDFQALIEHMKAALNPVTTWDDDMLKMAMRTIKDQQATWTWLVNRLIAITGDGSRSDMV